MIGGKYGREWDVCMGKYKNFPEWWLKIQWYLMAYWFPVLSHLDRIITIMQQFYTASLTARNNDMQKWVCISRHVSAYYAISVSVTTVLVVSPWF